MPSSLPCGERAAPASPCAAVTCPVQTAALAAVNRTACPARGGVDPDRLRIATPGRPCDDCSPCSDQPGVARSPDSERQAALVCRCRSRRVRHRCGTDRLRAQRQDCQGHAAADRAVAPIFQWWLPRHRRAAPPPRAFACHRTPPEGGRRQSVALACCFFRSRATSPARRFGRTPRRRRPSDTPTRYSARCCASRIDVGT